MTVVRIRLCALAVLTILAAGCATQEATDAHSETISRGDFGRSWPFTVKQGVLACGGAGAVTFEARGTTYAVNGMAEGQHTFADIEPIWKDDPQETGLKINIGPVIDRGLKLCEKGG